MISTATANLKFNSVSYVARPSDLSSIDMNNLFDIFNSVKTSFILR